MADYLADALKAGMAIRETIDSDPDRANRIANFIKREQAKQPPSLPSEGGEGEENIPNPFKFSEDAVQRIIATAQNIAQDHTYQKLEGDAKAAAEKWLLAKKAFEAKYKDAPAVTKSAEEVAKNEVMRRIDPTGFGMLGIDPKELEPIMSKALQEETSRRAFIGTKEVYVDPADKATVMPLKRNSDEAELAQLPYIRQQAEGKVSYHELSLVENALEGSYQAPQAAVPPGQLLDKPRDPSAAPVIQK